MHLSLNLFGDQKSKLRAAHDYNLMQDIYALSVMPDAMTALHQHFMSNELIFFSIIHPLESSRLKILGVGKFNQKNEY